jgi:hypothetical protein
MNDSLTPRAHAAKVRASQRAKEWANEMADIAILAAKVHAECGDDERFRNYWNVHLADDCPVEDAVALVKIGQHGKDVARAAFLRAAQPDFKLMIANGTAALDEMKTPDIGAAEAEGAEDAE